MKNFYQVIIALLFFKTGGLAQAADTLYIYYHENYPYAYTDNGKQKGIEIDIIEEYATWLKQKKNITAVLIYKSYNDFGDFYNSVKTGNKNVIGLGSVTFNSMREKEVLFSSPYLQNVSVLITAGKVPTLISKSAAEVTRVLGNLHGVAVSKSSHAVYLEDIKKQFLPSLKISYFENQTSVLESIVSDNTNFGYVDIVSYWAFLKNNQGKFLKIQKPFNEPKEYFRFIAPLNSINMISLDEFFESGFGFTSTKKYHQILETYLGYEIIESVEIK